MARAGRRRVERKEDIRELFVSRFYFGCEADDPLNAWAFNRRANPMGARLNALFSSDIGHFDVPDMTAVLPEAYELVEHGLLTDDDFREVMFTNAERFWGEVNPDFFKGTVVEVGGGGAGPAQEGRQHNHNIILPGPRSRPQRFLASRCTDLRRLLGESSAAVEGPLLLA